MRISTASRDTHKGEAFKIVLKTRWSIHPTAGSFKSLLTATRKTTSSLLVPRAQERRGSVSFWNHHEDIAKVQRRDFDFRRMA